MSKQLPVLEVTAPGCCTPMPRSGAETWLGEIVATFGLPPAILRGGRGTRGWMVPYAVAGYIGAAYWLTSATSFADLAVSMERTLTDTFAGVVARCVPVFIAAELIDAALAVTAIGLLFLRSRWAAREGEAASQHP